MLSGTNSGKIETNHKKRIGIIGTGLAGESVAYFLQNHSPHEVAAIFEANSKPGLHAHSIEVEGCPVDVPLRAVSPHYYPNLMALYHVLGVELQTVDYSCCGNYFKPNELVFRHDNFQVCGFAIPRIPWSDYVSLRLAVRSLRIVLDLLWFVFTGPFHLMMKRLGHGVTLGSFLRRERYSYDFVHLFLYPVMSSLLSCSYQQVDDYPAREILEFYCARSTTIFTGWRRVRCGVHDVSKKLLSGISQDRIRLNCSVRFVRTVGRIVEVEDAHGVIHHFDAVIIATESTSAHRIWVSKSEPAGQLLHSIRSFDANITVHSDASLMPTNQADWKGLNYFMNSHSSCSAASMTSAHLSEYHVPLRRAARQYFETWNPFVAPRDGTVISTVKMTRAVWTVEGGRNLRRFMEEVQGEGNVYLCGSYATSGITLLEQAVTSACEVAELLGAPLPFRKRPVYEAYWTFVLLAHILVLWRVIAMGLLAAVLCLSLVSQEKLVLICCPWTWWSFFQSS